MGGCALLEVIFGSHSRHEYTAVLRRDPLSTCGTNKVRIYRGQVFDATNERGRVFRRRQNKYIFLQALLQSMEGGCHETHSWSETNTESPHLLFPLHVGPRSPLWTASWPSKLLFLKRFTLLSTNTLLIVKRDSWKWIVQRSQNGIVGNGLSTIVNGIDWKNYINDRQRRSCATIG